MASIVQYARDNILYNYGYYRGRYFLPTSFSDAYGLAASKLSSLISLPLPLVSFLALPFFGGTSTSINLVFFYLTWSAFVLSRDQLSVEIWGTLAVRLIFYLLPALGFLGLDLFVPKISQSVKARGSRHIPLRLPKDQLVKVAAVASFNVLLSVALQALLEVLATRVFHMRSILKVTTTVPLPWNLGKDILKGFAIRNIVHYPIHRYLLHTQKSQLKKWHLSWQHSLPLPFSIGAAYDFPATYLLANWLPAFLPAYLFRFHVLTWHIFVALISLEDLLLYSGYAVLPSSIVLAGMARRTDAHFRTAHEAHGATGNFGHWGILDLVFGTTCTGASDALDDAQDEADKHHVQERLSGAAKGAKDGFKRPSSDEDAAEPDGDPTDANTTKRRSGRKKTKGSN